MNKTKEMLHARPSMRSGCWTKLRLLLPLLVTQILTLNLTVISSHSLDDIRCSYVPPTPEQVTHVWLNDAQSETPDRGFEIIDHERSTSTNMKESSHIDFNHRGRRHIGNPRGLVNDDSGVQSSMWNIIKKLEQPSPIDKEDLVPIKIQVYYDSSVYLLDRQELELITDTVMPSVVKYFESVLSIRREFSIDRFRISRRCPNNTIFYSRDVIGHSRPYCMDRCEDYATCGEMLVPQAHLSACSYCNSTSKKCGTNYSSEGKGVANAQLLLYVSAKQTARCKKDQTIAYAVHCAQDAKTDRPVAGHANLCPSSISTDPKDLKALIATVKHELTHVLGFSVSLFAYYRDEFGRPLTERNPSPGPIPVDSKTGYAKWSDKIIKKVVRSGWVTSEGQVNKEVHLVVTPTVVREVRNHFNCSTLEGAELEDQGSDGTSMTHWEKRLFENEAMTGTHTQNSVYSRITLAVLQDTGWYIANFSRAEKLEWGKALGCEFATKSCKSWIDSRRAKGQSIRPFCDRVKGDLLQIACTEDRASKAVCNMKQYKTPLSPTYQNFDKLDGVPSEKLAYYGGSVDLADFCPFIQEFTWQAQNVSVRGSRCDLNDNNLESERNAALEFYGSQSKCFEHGRRWESRSCVYKRHWHHYGAGCYRYTCSNGHIDVIVGNYSYPCYYQDQIIHIDQLVDQWLYTGTLVCPPCEKVCPSHKCKSFDKRIIDKILSLYKYNPNLNVSLGTGSAITTIIDDVMNSVDIKNSQDSSPKSALRQKSPDMRSDRNNPESNELPQKEYIMQIFAQHRRTPKHLLVCSGADSLIRNSSIPVFIMLVLCLTIPFMTRNAFSSLSMTTVTIN